MGVDLGFEFDPSELPPDEFEKLQVGRYLVQVVETEVNDTSRGDGRYLKAVMEVLDGQSQGRKWFENYNIRNNHPDAERIGNQQLEKLKAAVGVGGQRMRNTDMIEFKSFYIDVADRLNKRTGEMERVIKAYSPYSPVGSGRQQAAPRQQAQQRQPQQVPRQEPAQQQPSQQYQGNQQPLQASSGTRPWRR